MTWTDPILLVLMDGLFWFEFVLVDENYARYLYFEFVQGGGEKSSSSKDDDDDKSEKKKQPFSRTLSASTKSTQLFHSFLLDG